MSACSTFSFAPTHAVVGVGTGTLSIPIGLCLPHAAILSAPSGSGRCSAKACFVGAVSRISTSARVRTMRRIEEAIAQTRGTASSAARVEGQKTGPFRTAISFRYGGVSIAAQTRAFKLSPRFAVKEFLGLIHSRARLPTFYHQRPRPYQPPPASKSTTTTIIRRVFVSMKVSFGRTIGKSAQLTRV